MGSLTRPQYNCHLKVAFSSKDSTLDTAPPVPRQLNFETKVPRNDLAVNCWASGWSERQPRVALYLCFRNGVRRFRVITCIIRITGNLLLPLSWWWRHCAIGVEFLSVGILASICRSHETFDGCYAKLCITAIRRVKKSIFFVAKHWPR